MAIYCTVNFCSYAHTHNSAGHQCSKCFQYGHGPTECSNKFLLFNLTFNPIPKKLQCDISGCKHQNNHTNQGHKCRNCKQYGHTWKYCNIYAKCDLCNLKGHITSECIYINPSKIAGSAPGKIYITTYEGMGCYSIHKRNYPSEPFTTFNMHSDSWGQHGFSDVPKLKKFIEGYIPLRKIDVLLD